MELPDDRGSTEDWLLPEDRDPGPPRPSIEDRVSEALEAARNSARRATAAEEAAERARTEATARVDELAGRLEAALEKVEAGPRPTSRRPAGSRADQDTIRRFEERAERIVQRLRILERRPGIARPVGGGPGVMADRPRGQRPAEAARGRGGTRPG